MDVIPPVSGWLQHWLRPAVRHPLFGVPAHQTTRQMRRPSRLLLDARRMRRSHPCRRGHADRRLEVAPGTQLLPEPILRGGVLLVAGECEVFSIS